MDERKHLITLIDLMVGLSENQKRMIEDMSIEQLEEEYVLALQEKNDEMRCAKWWNFFWLCFLCLWRFRSSSQNGYYQFKNNGK